MDKRRQRKNTLKNTNDLKAYLLDFKRLEKSGQKSPNWKYVAKHPIRDHIPRSSGQI